MHADFMQKDCCRHCKSNDGANIVEFDRCLDVSCDLPLQVSRIYTILDCKLRESNILFFLLWVCVFFNFFSS